MTVNERQVAVTLVSIELTGTQKKTFEVGETFIYEGLVVTAYYSDETHKEVTGYTVTPPDLTTAGNKDVVVTYTEGDISKTASYIVTVNEQKVVVALVSIELSGNYLKSFRLNETFNYEGLVVTAYYSNNSHKEVTGYTVTPPDLTTSGNKDVIVTYTEDGVSVNTKYTVEVYDFESFKQEAILEVLDVFDGYDIDAYAKATWQTMVDKVNEAVTGIRNARDRADVSSIKNDAIEFLEGVMSMDDAVKDTWFTRRSGESNYEFSRDSDNNLVVTYNGYPGSWVHIGTDYFPGEVGENNSMTIKFRNDGDETINYRISLTNGGSYEVKTQISHLEKGQTATVTLSYRGNVSRLYFFLDSCEGEHNHQGKVTILETSLSHGELPLPETAVATPSGNGALILGDEGINTKYVLTAQDEPTLIDRVDLVVDVDYHNNSDSNRYFGLRLNAIKGYDISNADGTAQHNNDSRLYFQIPIDKNNVLTVGTELSTTVRYIPPTGAGVNDLTFTVVQYVLHYTTWKTQVDEVVEINSAVYDLDKENKINNGSPVEVKFANLNKVGRLNRVDINFSTINEASYGKSQLYISGDIDFVLFPTINNLSVINLGKYMNESSSEPRTDTVSLYPTNEVNLANPNGKMKIECWWASANNITINSITFYTDNVLPPQKPASIEAHPIDQGMFLEWGSSELTNSYEVYVDNALNQEVKITSCTINGLTNGQEYTFGVKAKNASGVSEMITITSAPVEGAVYDNFIYGVNNSLEEEIGIDNIQNNMFEQSVYYLNKSNNERFKSKIEAMENGTATTIAFMGGSITVGEQANLEDENRHKKGYAYYTYQWLKEHYDPQECSTFINGSISGTGSEIGIVRAQKDILDHNPDIIFIEYAANNGNTDFFKQSYESLIRKCLSLPSNPAVILVFSCTSYTYNGTETQYMAPMGEHYHLPMFSFDKALRSVVSVTDKDRTDPIFKAFTNDATHPNDNGHQLYAKCLAYYLKELLRREKDDPVGNIAATTSGYDKYENLISVDNTNSDGLITSLGSFVAANTATDSTSRQSDVTAFQQGWLKTDTETNNEMTIEVNAKNFILIYGAGNPEIETEPKGTMIIEYVNANDPSDTGTISFDLQKTNSQRNMSDLSEITVGGDGWGNPVAILVFDKATAGNYIIKIKMENTNETARIMAFGYTA